MRAPASGPLTSLVRLVGRYVIATAMIPVGVALGVGGLIQHAIRQRRRPAPPSPANLKR